MSVRGFTAAFDWSRSGGYNRPYEDVSSDVDDDDLTIEVGRDTSTAAASIPATTLDLSLDDRNLTYAPELVSSPIGGKVKPGVPFLFTLTVSAATTTLYAGSITDFDYDSTGQRMTVHVTDAWGAPSQQKLSTPVYRGMRTGDLVNVVLDAIGWATDKRSVDSGATAVPYWWEEGTDAAGAIQKLVDSEGPPALAYVQGGVFYFRDRFHRLTNTASLTSQATFTRIVPQGTGPGGDFKMLTDSIGYNHGTAQLANTVQFSVDVRQPGPLGPVWSTDSPVSVPAGQTLLIGVQGNDPFINAVVPAQSTGFDANGDPNGDYVLAYGSLASVTLSRTSGQATLLTIVGGGTDALLTNLQVRGNPLGVAQTVQVSAVDVSSVGSKGTLTWAGDVPWCNPYDAQAIANKIVATYNDNRPVITFAVDGGISTAYLQQFAARQVSDRITVRDDVLGINADYMIEKIRRTVKSLGKSAILLEITAEPVMPTGSANPFMFDTAGQGFNQGTFAADGLDNPTTLFRFDTAGQGFNQGLMGS